MRVAVLGKTVVNNLFEGHAPVGELIRINNVPFEVIGVLSEKGSQGFMNPDEQIWIPLLTARYRVHGTDRIRNMNVKVASPGEMNVAMIEIERVLRRTRCDVFLRERGDLRPLEFRRQPLEIYSGIRGRVCVFLCVRSRCRLLPGWLCGGFRATCGENGGPGYEIVIPAPALPFRSHWRGAGRREDGRPFELEGIEGGIRKFQLRHLLEQLTRRRAGGCELEQT